MDKPSVYISFFMAAVTIWIVRKYLNSLLQKKKSINILGVMAWSLYYIYQVVLENGMTGSIILVLVNAILIFFICHSTYHGVIRTKILYVVLLCVMWSIVEMIAFFILQTIISTEAKMFQTFGSVLTKLLLVIMVIGFGSRFREGGKKNLSTKYVLMLLAVSVSGIIIAYNLFLMNVNENYVLSMISFVLLLFMNCMIFEIYQNLYKNMEIERENAIFAKQLQLVCEHKAEEEKLRRKQREIHHNFVNFCMGLKADVNEGKYDKAVREIDELLKKELSSSRRIVNSGNELVDSLINHKYEIAYNKDINFEVSANIPEKLPIEYGDLAIVLGNLIDNAIEAAQNCIEDKRIIISIGIKRAELVLVVQNTFQDCPQLDQWGNFVTNKKNSNQHGFGIPSVKRIADKYEGNSLFQIKDNMFEAIILIHLSEVLING